MAGTLGRVEEFDSNKDDWQQYVERLEHFFQANDVDGAENKRAVFLSVIGSATYKILRNLLSPAKPGEKSYADLVDTSKHFKPAPSEIVECFRFNSRVRKPGESIAAFIAELRALAEFCNFGDTLEAMLRDRIVCGINGDSIQRRLLSESKLDYAKAMETALNMETAAQSMKTLKNEAGDLSAGGDSPAQPQVNRMGTTPSKSGQSVPTCYRCGICGHAVSKCRVDKNIICHYCQKKGHMQRACKSKSKGVAPMSDTGTQRPKSRVSNQTGGLHGRRVGLR